MHRPQACEGQRPRSPRDAGQRRLHRGRGLQPDKGGGRCEGTWDGTGKAGRSCHFLRCEGHLQTTCRSVKVTERHLLPSTSRLGVLTRLGPGDLSDRRGLAADDRGALGAGGRETPRTREDANRGRLLSCGQGSCRHTTGLSPAPSRADRGHAGSDSKHSTAPNAVVGKRRLSGP